MTITRIQGNAKAYAASNSLNVTMASTPTNGDVLIAVVGAVSTAQILVNSITQTNVTWTQEVSQSRNHVGSWWEHVGIWIGIVGSGASTSATVSFNVAGWTIADICEYSGVQTSGALDQTTTNYGYGTSASTGTTPTTTQEEELWVGATRCDTGNETSPTNGFTLLDGIANDGNLWALGYLEKKVSSTGTASAGVTCGNNYWNGCIATFKASGGSDLEVTGNLTVDESATVYRHANFINSSSLITKQQLADHLYKVGQTPEEFDWATIPQYIKFYNPTTAI